ncbi:MAG: hypothetical protein HC788_04915 [Sphingopyxis sp.]|nr:hypothetical protein [Sphingopyxis sp.]
MLTLLEFCDTFRISHAKAKRMLKRGVLLVDETADPRGARIREVFLSRNPLGVIDLCDLLEEPELILQLGRFTDKASLQLESLGDARGSQAPRDVALSVMDAANGDADAITTLVGWIKGALPDDGSPVGYHWLAVRLMLPIAQNVRQFQTVKIRRALGNCRKDPAFAGWWKYDGRKSRKVTIYAKPLASLDL